MREWYPPTSLLVKSILELLAILPSAEAFIELADELVLSHC